MKKEGMHTKEKARCKIFTNSYKNINMNKLIFLYISLLPSYLPSWFFFQQMEKNQGERGALLRLYVSFDALI